MYERQIFGAGGKVGKCLGCFHMGVVVTLERPCRKNTETRYNDDNASLPAQYQMRYTIRYDTIRYEMLF